MNRGSRQTASSSIFACVRTASGGDPRQIFALRAVCTCHPETMEVGGARQRSAAMRLGASARFGSQAYRRSSSHTVRILVAHAMSRPQSGTARMFNLKAAPSPYRKRTTPVAFPNSGCSACRRHKNEKRIRKANTKTHRYFRALQDGAPVVVKGVTVNGNKR